MERCPPSGILFVSSREIVQILGQDYVFWKQFGFLRHNYEAAQSLTCNYYHEESAPVRLIPCPNILLG